MKRLKYLLMNGTFFLILASLCAACSTSPSATEVAAQKEKERQRQLQRSDDSYENLEEETKRDTGYE